MGGGTQAPLVGGEPGGCCRVAAPVGDGCVAPAAEWPQQRGAAAGSPGWAVPCQQASAMGQCCTLVMPQRSPWPWALWGSSSVPGLLPCSLWGRPTFYLPSPLTLGLQNEQGIGFCCVQNQLLGIRVPPQSFFECPPAHRSLSDVRVCAAGTMD